MFAVLSVFRKIGIVALVLVLSGCATTYKQVPYDSLDYTGAQSTEGLNIAYRYEAQPGYYGDKARKRGYDVVAVRVTNTQDTPAMLTAGTLRIASNGMPISAVRPNVVAGNIKQPVWTYLLWNLANITITDEDGFVAFIPLGLGISILNMITSSSANGKVQNAYTEQHLMGMTVPPGQTVEGLLFLSTTSFAPLTFEYVPSSSTPMPDPAN